MIDHVGDHYGRFVLSIKNNQTFHIGEANATSAFNKIRIKDIYGIKF